MHHRKLSKSLVWISAAAVCGAILIGLAPQVQANPPDIPHGWKKVYQWNLIGYPEGQEYTGGCGNGHRMFVNRNANHAHILVVDGVGWEIIDCNATADNQGELQSDNDAVYHLFAKILGPPGGNINICADTYEDHETGEHLCELGEIDLTRNGKDKFRLVPRTMFDAELEDIIWSIWTNGNFGHVQFRVYEETAD